MDTSTHITMGFGLAGLAYLDPAVSSNQELAYAILLGSVIGSNAPDFDYAIKLIRGNGMYTEYHRGISHSIPALFIWTFIITGALFMFFKEIPVIPLIFWTFLAVMLHVLFDIMNAYGTQAVRPFSKKWLSLNIIPLFDPVIIVAHVIGFIFWFTGVNPGVVFLYVYFFVMLYILCRFFVSFKTRKFIFSQANREGILTLIPSTKLNKWDFVLESETTYHVGSVKGKEFSMIHNFDKYNPNCLIIKNSLKDRNVQHFLANSKHTHVIHFPISTGFEVRWIDLRFRHKNHYPYMAIVELDRSQNIVASYTGWIHHSRKLNTKLLTNKNRPMPL